MFINVPSRDKMFCMFYLKKKDLTDMCSRRTGSLVTRDFTCNHERVGGIQIQIPLSVSLKSNNVLFCHHKLVYTEWPWMFSTISSSALSRRLVSLPPGFQNKHKVDICCCYRLRCYWFNVLTPLLCDHGNHRRGGNITAANCIVLSVCSFAVHTLKPFRI